MSPAVEAPGGTDVSAADGAEPAQDSRKCTASHYQMASNVGDSQ